MESKPPSPAEPPTLFPLPEPSPEPPPPERVDPMRGVRIRRADRSQIILGPIDLDAQIPDDHPARDIWALVERLDLSELYRKIEAREGVAGAPAIDPKILLALWIFATSEGEGSARQIAELIELHSAYRWLCGGVDVNHHTLSDFRSDSGEVLDDLITQVLALLMNQKLVSLTRIAQDGTRVRASAGAASFRKAQTLGELMEQARAHLEEVKKDADGGAMSARRAAARVRGARERLERIEAAMAQLPEIEKVKKRSGAKEKTPRVSTTDPDARVMKMGDGGFRPALNVQFATTADGARVIVGVDVGNGGTDAGRTTPMLDQIEKRTGTRPSELLVDGGYVKFEAIEEAQAKDVSIYAPIPKPREGDSRDPFEARETDGPGVAKWRARMATDEAKGIYKNRASTVETVNADAKTHRGLDHFSVRGLSKAHSVACLFSLTYNILRFITLTSG